MEVEDRLGPKVHLARLGLGSRRKNEAAAAFLRLPSVSDPYDWTTP